MLSTNTSPIEFYASIANDPLILANGYLLIRDFLLKDQQHRRDTILNLLSPAAPVLSLVLNLYPNEILASPDIDDVEKDSTVEFVLHTLVQQLTKPPPVYRPKEVSQLTEFMLKVHNNLGFDRWVGIYLAALSKIAQQSEARFGEFLISILKNSDDRVSVLSQELVPKLMDFKFASAEDRLEIYYYLLKSLAFKVDTDPDLIDTHVRPHLSAILHYTTTNVQLSAKSLKFCLKTMTLLFGDYGQPCSRELVSQIELTSEYLIVEYIGFLNSSLSFEKGEDDLEEDQQPIEIALYQMLQLLMTLFGSRAKINLERVLYLCIISTYLGQAQYKKYVQLSDQYLMDVEDEGETNIRNKSTFFLNELLENDKYSKQCAAMLTEYCGDILLNLGTVQQSVYSFLQKHGLPQHTLKISEIYTESALFILHSFTDELLHDKVAEISSILINQVKASSARSINPILSVLILNKCARTGNEAQKRYYLSFLRSLIGPFSNNIGMLISLARGIYLFASPQDLRISRSLEEGVPAVLVGNLNEYLFGQDSAQQDSAYLILQFFVHLLKCGDNQAVLQEMIPVNKEIALLKRFLSTGMTSRIVIQLTEKMANPQTLQAIWKQIQNGFAKDENLSEIISTCLRNKSISLSESQVIHLCQVYRSRLDLVANILGAYTQQCPIVSEQLIDFLSEQARQEWIPGLLVQGKLKNIEQHFIGTVKAITHELESPEQLENQLLVPYFAILNNTDTAIQMLNQQNLLFDFFEKLYRYAKLFQGTHLKIVTSHIFISLAEKLPNLIPKVLELVRSYGKIESNEWEDEDELADLGENFQLTEGFIDKIFSRIINDRVEEVFKTAFGELAWDSQRLYERLARLEASV